MDTKQTKKKNWSSLIAFAFGNLGHSAFYGALSTYFIVFVTSSMFVGLSQHVANKLIGLITGLVVVIRIVEILIDPILGNIVDNTQSKWGKFKPWIVWGNIVSAVLLVVLFTGIFGLAHKNWILFAILFVIIFIVLDVFYSFSDVSYWGMVPALSEDSDERGLYTSLGAFAGTLGWNGLTVIVIPIVTYFTYTTTGKHEQGAPGWLAFAIIISVVALLSALSVALGTKEKDNIIRTAAKKETTIKDVFLAIAKNDQILWASLAYFLYSFAYVVTNGVLLYFFKYVLDKPAEFSLVGVIALIIGFCTSPLYPLLNKFIPRKVLFCFGQCCMISSYVIFIFGRENMALLFLGIVLFNISFAQLVTVLTLTDAIEYGQLKTGERNEAVVLAVRPMIDKLTGAFSNGLVGYIAIAAGMTGSATAADITAKNIRTFDSLAFYIPLVLAALALLVFVTKVKLSEAKHAQIVEQLKENLAQGKITQPMANLSGTTEVCAPIAGEICELKDIHFQPGDAGFMATGLGIYPQGNQIFAPFDGTVKFTFSTKHVVGLVSDAGLEMLIHVGVGTVNLRGAGFKTYYDDGQKIKAGQLLLEFDADLIADKGYDDTILLFMTQPNRITKYERNPVTNVAVQEKLLTVTIK